MKILDYQRNVDTRLINKCADYITMEDIESFCSMYIKRELDGAYVYLTAPVLVCMALDGRWKVVKNICDKFPLVDYSGWTPWLRKQEKYRKLSHLCLVDKYLTCHSVYEEINTMEALLMSNIDDFRWVEAFNDKVQIRKEMSKKFISVDKITKLKYEAMSSVCDIA